MRKAFFAALFLAAVLPHAGLAAEKVAIFDFELYDTSLEGEMRGPDPAEAKRLEMITGIVRDAYREAGYEIVDIGPLRERLASMPQLRTCKGCEVRLAEELGAELAVSGFVHKISTLILGVSVSIHDVENRTLVDRLNASIRGNTDESWEHGIRYMVRYDLFPEEARAAGK